MTKNISKYYVYCQVIGWSFYWMCLLFFSWAFSKRISVYDVEKSAIFIFIGCISTHLLRRLLYQIDWMKLSSRKIILRVFLGAMLINFLVATITTVGISLLGYLTLYRPFTITLLKIYANIMQGSVFIIPWALIYSFSLYIAQKRAHEKKPDYIKMKSINAKAEIQSEQSYADVGSLIDSLTQIQDLIGNDPASARKKITEFSSLLRKGLINL